MIHPKFYFLILTCICVLFNVKTYAQTDTGKIKTQTYLQVYYSLTNTPGTLGGKSNLSIEVGKQWNVFSLGVDLGKTTLEHIKGRDTSFYFEVRPNLNIFQQGRFTNTLTVGVGYVFLAPNNFLSELTSGIEYTATDRLHLNVNFGQFYYSGRYTASSVTFFGVSASYYFLPYKNRSSIIKPK
ncbi:hypothetical protein [Mucilaginibacter arboris]|uniref:Outer membrane protein beta-barrel domain-containing protein n=1 Tax=Mucilaginibacter arboris TaxID=2682090 RepID=A0A7K1SVX0_9SPHI|nr:hypothetical protein [Mucilaginibacter arboris]MVN21387.1 hypothetical protein [Mucilaginibacter arboris]